MSESPALDHALKSIENIHLARVAGRLVRVTGLLLESVGCRLAIGQRCRIESVDETFIEAQVVGFDRDITYLMPFKHPGGVLGGARVFPSEQDGELLIGDSWLGRVINGLGEPLDGKGQLGGSTPLQQQLPQIHPLQRRAVDTPLDVGVNAINGLLTIGKGQRVGLMAGSGVGKSVLLGMITRYTQADVVVVAAPADESPLMRIKATELCHAIATYYRDKGHDVLLLVDSLTRYAMAQREIALSLGEPPATKGYPPSAFSIIPRLAESAGNSSGNGTMTAIYTVLAEAGHYPAIDISQSISRCMSQVIGSQQAKAASLLKQCYADYMAIKPLIPLGGYVAGADPMADQAVHYYPAITQFLRQEVGHPALFSASVEQLTGMFPSFAPTDEA
ncbi:flagellum-specific ATP synthase FliI [Yersinia pestis]|uniref:hypothetical protein n=1 Tax=Yersinia pestis TaxID=632 RepID=UPI00005F655A|nr:hypothetical protein [Yersinia pestis]ABX85822.1 flagellum-specific ATP synthase [Yersinia pestis Angola]AJJ85239.1 ATP synthase alpha/beta family, nucleotide-binding domain protein [Yersinia pestis Angola]